MIQFSINHHFNAQWYITVRHQPLRRVFVAVMAQWWGQKCFLLWIRVIIKVDWATTVFYPPLQTITHPFINPCLNCRPWSYIFLSCCTQLLCKLSTNALCCFSGAVNWCQGLVLVFCTKIMVHHVLVDSAGGWGEGDEKLICSFWSRFYISAPCAIFPVLLTAGFPNRHCGAWCVQQLLMRVSKCFRQEGLNINVPRKTRNLAHFCRVESVHYFQRCCSFSDKTSVCFSV